MFDDEKKYKACIYARLSQEDGDKSESDSIVSQKAMIREFVENHPDIEIVSEKVDDGYSGVNFDRPGFQEMMEEIREGKVNCVIVKDLSRFGRNYIEAGNFLEKVFPFLGVRFISINDYLDSTDKHNADSLVVPFKNLINDAYCKDISVKIRTQLEIKRKKGQYTGPEPVYGYEKDPNDHNHLVPDPYAAEVVRNIFLWKLQGMSIGRIVEKLNAEGVLCPMEYKMSKGVWTPTVFRTGLKALWSYNTIKLMLQNEVYLGTMIQGKSATPNHKVKKNFLKDKEDWIRVEGTHEPIVEEFVFREVQAQLKMDTRVAQGKSYVYPFAGYLVCADCGQNLTRKAVFNGGKQYVYYRCSTYKAGLGCTIHSIKEHELEEAVLAAVRTRVAAVCDMTRLFGAMGRRRPREIDIRNFDRQVARLQEEIEKKEKYKMQLYESLQEGSISKKDYEIFRKNYEKQIEDTEASIHLVEQQKEEMIKGEVQDFGWMRRFRKYKNITEIDRMVVVELIDHIAVTEDCRIEIHFRYEDDYNEACKMIEKITGEEENVDGTEEQKRIS